jgi:hypothetical protein
MVRGEAPFSISKYSKKLLQYFTKGDIFFDDWAVDMFLGKLIVK